MITQTDHATVELVRCSLEAAATIIHCLYAG